MAIDYSLSAIPKPPSRKMLKGRVKAKEADRVHRVRMYVMGRERGICRCCRLRPATEMHELRFRSLGGKVSRQNSIGVCRDCHGYLQTHSIDVTQTRNGAEGALVFIPNSLAAADLMRLTPTKALVSRPGSQREDAE